MQKVEENRPKDALASTATTKLPVSVIIPVRNEAANLPRCLEALRELGEVYVIDSQSTDSTVEIARAHGAQVVQFHYQGGWPKKRQWAMDTLPLAYDWILLLDADEVLTPELILEIRQAIQNPTVNGYYLALRIFFLGRVLRHGDARFWKLSLFRRGKGRSRYALVGRVSDFGPSRSFRKPTLPLVRGFGAHHLVGAGNHQRL